jgi:hypothetical protein|tara:strand:- start:395 stop:592 length:198 start_codon:yes stop_codon:yes gene_type:complete
MTTISMKRLIQILRLLFKRYLGTQVDKPTVYNRISTVTPIARELMFGLRELALALRTLHKIDQTV